MKIYMLHLCALLLFFYNIIKCSENEGDENEMTLSSGDGSSVGEGCSTRKKRALYLNYNKIPPHSREMTAELKSLLTEKEEQSIKQVNQWEDMRKYPHEQHKQYWDSLCQSLWPGIPDVINFMDWRKLQPSCLSNHFTMPGSGFVRAKKYLRGFRHDYNPSIHKDILPFSGDFICCHCKYVKNNSSSMGIPYSGRYFFAMKVGEREYFLLKKISKVAAMNRKIKGYTGSLLQIVDYVILPEFKDINLNI